tara:strand:+ start:180 stop:473 length:294 start_codon:yes stop_codon:yes gene_type:complete
MISNKYRPIEGADEGNIRILDENYKNVAVSIGKVTIQEQKNSKDEATLKYDYDILELPEDVKLDKDFDNLLGDIIVDILETKLKEDPESVRFDNSAD